MPSHRPFAVPLLLALVAGVASPAAVRADDPPAGEGGRSPGAGSAAAPAADRAGERVRLRLKGGGTAEGVVLAKDTWERRDREKGWVSARRDEAGAGVRLWYVGDLDGFQWVAATEIVDMKSLGALTAEDRRQLDLRRSVAQRQAQEARRDIDAKRAADADAAAKARALLDEVTRLKGEKEAAAAVDAAKKSDAEKATRWAELLAKFPPGEWTPETPKQIDQRRLTLHVFPSDEEQEFLEVFEEWRAAYAGWMLAQEAAKAAPKGR